MNGNENSKCFALGDDEMDSVTGGYNELSVDNRYQLEKCPDFAASNDVNSILNKPRASDTAKSAIRQDLGRCGKCAASSYCSKPADEKRRYGG